jgi:hypothetical protein
MADYSPTGYWANYRTIWVEPNSDPAWPFPTRITSSLTESLPIIGYTDTALVLDNDGAVQTVGALLNTMREGSDTPDEEGHTYTVRLSVDPFPEEERA